MSLQNKTFNELITFTRATGGGRFNSAGQYEWLSAGQPRFDFDPVTLEPRGILIEEQRTNLLTYSEQFDNEAAWVKVNANVIANAVIAPDGTLSGDKLVEDTGSTNHFNRQPKTVVPDTIYTFSCYLKAGERTQGSLEIYTGKTVYKAVFNLVTGAFITSAGVGSYVVTPIGNGWFRFAITAVASTTTLNGLIYPASGQITNYTGDGTSGIFIWGAQLEAGAFPTSYIPTTTAQVTRAADVCSVNNLSPWYRADEGTLMVEASVADYSKTTPAEHPTGIFSAGTAGNRMGLRAYSDALGALQWDSLVVVNSVYEWDANQRSINTPNAVVRSGFAYKKNSVANSVNGSLTSVGDLANIPVVTRLELGKNSAVSPVQGTRHLRCVRYIPRRISDTELQALTAL